VAAHTFFQSVSATNSSRNFLQSLKAAFVIPSSAVHLFAALHRQAVRFTNLSDFFSQLGDAFFDGILHDDPTSMKISSLAKLPLHHARKTNIQIPVPRESFL
jgi:hypothetical protein